MYFSADQLLVISREVEKQGEPPTKVPALCLALDWAWDMRKHFGVTVEMNHSELQIIAGIVNGGTKFMSYRSTPVTFRNGGSSARPENIHHTLDNILSSFRVGMSVESLKTYVKEFLWIHPFTDGNGRTAFVLWNMFGQMYADSNNICQKITPLPEFDWMP